ncbi:MAG: metalloregulator ArsR/SmtB family transcription factor [Alkalibacterium sp.]|uniref:Helix-turn-helix transcriptional regulator n=2 Tax=Lactobacillales TaxID=186826 RepID=A0A839A8Y4_9LACT|nr:MULTISPECIES: metalloregulator ArsR/SmtB family transcription factor [Lactobacillales]MBA5730163.1 helix-turn-helix transcriptional regulator [Ruoffia halotolerans]MBC9708225.1 helix-turn-helix transcriptional regulator [Enterococcus sp.]MDN6294536.1 metalloregulator ArsR/SmtB family transcription factor [Alkalibacterium sp.]MDN6295971.1 metalloregulator ArsR/SmtB family transcription factor [Alkalibacterium sp.]
MTAEVCTTNSIHKEKVASVKKNLKDKDLSTLLILGKCFSDSSRIKIFYALETYKEMCVCDLAAILNASIATTSHHLRFLKKNGMAKSRQDGKVVYYSLVNEEILSAVQDFLKLSENSSMKI